ncbi:MAG: hypothetical protein GX801_01130 [Fibrobacter sp.]|nr:hypothetical protein [Fibrobacter sp.]
MKYYTIGELCSITKGKTGIMKAIPGSYPLVTTSFERKTSNSYDFDDDAVCIPLVSSTGHGHKSLNYIHYQSGKFALGTILAAIIPKDKSVLLAEYLQRYLYFFKDQLVVPLMRGAANVSLAIRDIAKIKVPVPSIEKQKEYIKLFNKAEIGKIELLYETTNQSTYLSKLRQAILQEAIEAKLTAGWRKEQERNLAKDAETAKISLSELRALREKDPNYNALALLENIQTEKEKLIKEKKIRKAKPLAPIKAEEIPFELPKNWVWTRLGEIADVGTGATPLTTNDAYYKNGGFNWVTSSSTGMPFVENPDKLITNKALAETNCKVYPVHTLIIAMYGQGKTRGQISELLIPAATNQAVAAIQLCNKNDNHRRFIKIFFQNHYHEIRKLASGGAQPNLNLQKIITTKIPLPPLAEQQAIVSRVEKLLAMVYELEQQVTARKDQSEQLMQSVLKEAFSGGN